MKFLNAIGLMFGIFILLFGFIIMGAGGFYAFSGRRVAEFDAIWYGEGPSQDTSNRFFLGLIVTAVGLFITIFGGLITFFSVKPSLERYAESPY